MVASAARPFPSGDTGGAVRSSDCQCMIGMTEVCTKHRYFERLIRVCFLRAPLLRVPVHNSSFWGTLKVVCAYFLSPYPRYLTDVESIQATEYSSRKYQRVSWSRRLQIHTVAPYLCGAHIRHVIPSVHVDIQLR